MQNDFNESISQLKKDKKKREKKLMEKTYEKKMVKIGFAVNLVDLFVVTSNAELQAQLSFRTAKLWTILERTPS